MIKLNEVCFKYRNTKDISLDNINIEIKKGLNPYPWLSPRKY